MVADLGTIVRVEISKDGIDSAIDFCESNDVLGDIASMLSDLKADIETGAEIGIENLAEKNQSLQEDFITSNGSIVSGNLVSSILIDEYSSTEYYIGTFVDYAKFVEEGRGPVYPVSKKALYFQIGGTDVFAKSVRPAKARPFVEPAFRQTENIAIETIEEAINNVIN